MLDPGLDPRMAPDATQLGRRRADDSPSTASGRMGPPPARAALDQQLPAEPRGRRRARDERRASESYEHGPELVPIIKPLDDFGPPPVTNEPPPLVPIFPGRPDASPTSSIPTSSVPTSGSATGRRARRAAEEAAAIQAGELAAGRRRGPDDRGVRRQRSGPAEDVTGTRTGELGGRRRAAAEDEGYEGAGLRRQRPGHPDFAPGHTDAIPGRNGFDPETTGGRRNGFEAAARADETAPFRPGEDTGRRRRPGYADDEPGEIGGRRNGIPGRPDETAPFRRGEDSGVRRQRPGYGDTRGGEIGEPRRARNGYDADEVAGFRRDDTGTARRTRAGFESSAPATDARRRDDTGVRRREEAMRRHPAIDEAPLQRRAPDDAMAGRPYDPYDDPSAVRHRGDARRGTGEYSGDYTTGGTRRALREPPGGRPAGPPGRPDRSDRLDGPERSGRPGGRGRMAPVADGAPLHRPHRWVAMLSVIAVVLVLGACAIGTWFIFKDERNGPESAKSSVTAGPKKRDISSRQVDPNPLTEAEVFPQNNIVAVPNEPPYVILATKASTDCKVAATEDLATLLVKSGCTEVVRATMKSPNEEYLITAGIFNLTSEKTAKDAFDGVKGIVDGQKGRFAGMSVGAGTGTDALVRAPTQLGWNYKGHFIAYCVIARVDGNPFAADDPYPNQITYDIVETYLENGIIDGRAIVQPDPTPAASLPNSQPAPK